MFSNAEQVLTEALLSNKKQSSDSQSWTCVVWNTRADVGLVLFWPPHRRAWFKDIGYKLQEEYNCSHLPVAEDAAQ